MWIDESGKKVRRSGKSDRVHKCDCPLFSTPPPPLPRNPPSPLHPPLTSTTNTRGRFVCFDVVCISYQPLCKCVAPSFNIVRCVTLFVGAESVSLPRPLPYFFSFSFFFVVFAPYRPLLSVLGVEKWRRSLHIYFPLLPDWLRRRT